METISGTIRQIKGPYANGFCILTVDPHGTVTGPLSDFYPGDIASFQGDFKSHPRYGKQFVAQHAALDVPRDADGIRGYLSSHFRWIGPVLADRLIEAFGDKLFSVIESNCQRLTAVNGITSARAEDIRNEWMDIKEDHDADLFFSKNHITLNMRNRLVSVYGTKAEAIKKIKSNPYLLADDIHGVGFKRADQIALAIGIPRDSAVRVGSCMRHILKEATVEGHCYLPNAELIAKCQEYIACDESKIHEAITNALQAEKIMWIDEPLIIPETGQETIEPLIYDASMHRAETEVARKLMALARRPHQEIMSSLTAEDIEELDDDQRKALALALRSKILIVTGGPGCLSGDTELMIVRGDKRVLKSHGRKYSLREAYHKFNRVYRSGVGKTGQNKLWASMPTYTLSLKNNDLIGYNEIDQIVMSGVRPVYTVTTDSGNKLKATLDHPFSVPTGTKGEDEDGFKPLSELSVGDTVLCRCDRYASNGKKKDRRRRVLETLKFHPFGSTHIVNGSLYKRVAAARIIIEAEMNGLPVGEFVYALQTDRTRSDRFTYLERSQNVHRKDSNPGNDVRSNLEVMSKTEHDRLHSNTERVAHFGNVLAIEEKIVSIKYCGEEETYDVVMKDPHRNFVANNFIVHNCGKTHTTRKIIEALGDRSVSLAAPTGKAAKRMSEVIGREAKTIHRLLEYNPGLNGFARNHDNPLECDTLLIDETSMIDIRLMRSLLDAVTLATQVIFVGDHDQLPSVGPGRVLADMIESDVLPVAHLRELHRQAELSRINQNARKINAGVKITAGDFNRDGDFWFVPAEDSTEIPALISKILQAIPAKFGFSFDDIQVLAPQKRGPIGTQNLNETLGPVLNPEGVKLAGVPYRSGDRVIQTRNNYKLGIFNGDIGKVIDSDRDYLHVGFEDLRGVREIACPLEDLSDLQLAWALTVHKYQGSEQPVIVIPVHTSNYMMLKRNLLYTAVTRGKRLVVCVGTLKAMNIAVRTLDASTRYSRLKVLLRRDVIAA